MRKLKLPTTLLLGIISLLVPIPVFARANIDTKWHCPADWKEHKFNVGDTPDHQFVISQGTCNAIATTKAVAEKEAKFIDFFDVSNNGTKAQGYFISTLDGGDAIYYHHEFNSAKPLSEITAYKFKIVGGTGKYKDAKGSATCIGVVNKDNSADWSCKGTLLSPT